MHITYADAGLVSDIGHHASSCRFIAGALKARGHQVTVAAFQGIQPELAAELDARAHFRINTYWGTDGDPVCGWLNAFFTAANAFAEDLARSGPLSRDDLLYVNSVLPAQLFGIRSFLLALPEAARPHVICELGTGPGLDHVQTEDGPRFVARDPRIDSRATLYRFAGAQIASAALPQLHVCSFDRGSSELYSQLLGLHVATLPVPHFAEAAVRSHRVARPLTIGVLGHQRGEKGYALVPQIVAQLLRERTDIQFLVHNAQPDFMTDVQGEMRSLATHDARITLDERPADLTRWQKLLAGCDLILCPYMPDQFRAAYSALTSEAIAHGIPVVVPAETTMARVLAEFGSPGATFSGYSAEAVVAATRHALDLFDELVARASTAAARWRETMGARHTVDAMLAMTAGADMQGRQARRGRLPPVDPAPETRTSSPTEAS